jgi:hypothetical protein
MWKNTGYNPHWKNTGYNPHWKNRGYNPHWKKTGYNPHWKNTGYNPHWKQRKNIQGVIFGFRHEVDENSAILGYYSASSGNFLPTFRENVSVPSSGVHNPFGSFWILDS